tara:strand:- start:503 stop:649 length:147 start_codon:yes stop_codon:yes gene_type:complete
MSKRYGLDDNIKKELKENIKKIKLIDICGLSYKSSRIKLAEHLIKTIN